MNSNKDDLKGNKEALLKLLAECAARWDDVDSHSKADEALIDYIGDEDIARAYDEVKTWYE